MVKQVAEKKMAPGTRVLRDELYPIKVDNVNRSVVLDDEGNIRTGAAEAFSQENETTAGKDCLAEQERHSESLWIDGGLRHQRERCKEIVE
jgi:hypothetical protein